MTPLLGLAVWLACSAAPTFESEPIFPPEPKHNHASCVVQLPDGSLMAAWYRGSGERKADDVQVMAARKPEGASGWSKPFVLADTPGYPDANPSLFSAPDGSLWLFWPTILDHRWEGALLKFKKAADPGTSGAPRWDREGVLHVTPSGFAEAWAKAAEGIDRSDLKIDASNVALQAERSRDILYQRLGWMPRVHPTVLPSGRWLLPLYTDTFSASIIALSDDQGESWSFSTPMVAFGNIQPSLVYKKDGTVVAYMRDNGPLRRIRESTSKDQGETWSPVSTTDLPNPGAGIEALRLSDGRWVMAYNDTTSGRNSLAISLSSDEGRTWPVTRHVERSPSRGDQFHYPSVMQAKDGTIHLTYTRRVNGKSTIQHARFPVGWVEQGDTGK